MQEITSHHTLGLISQLIAYSILCQGVLISTEQGGFFTEWVHFAVLSLGKQPSAYGGFVVEKIFYGGGGLVPGGLPFLQY